MKNIKFLPVFLLLLFGGTTFGQSQDYIRYCRGETEDDGELQIAIESWTTQNGVKIDLYGVVHMADVDYYQTVQHDLNDYDSVLYEGIKQGDTPNKETQILNMVQRGMATLLGLQFQKDGIDYTQKNLIHADIDASALQKSLDGKHITPFGGMIPPDMLDRLKPLIDMAGVFLDKYLKANPQFRNGLKLQMAQQMCQTDVETQLPPRMRKAIIYDRNQIVVNALLERLKTKDKRIAIFYGAGHNNDFARRFQALGYSRGNKRWLPAWTIGNGAIERQKGR